MKRTVEALMMETQMNFKKSKQTKEHDWDEVFEAIHVLPRDLVEAHIIPYLGCHNHMTDHPYCYCNLRQRMYDNSPKISVDRAIFAWLIGKPWANTKCNVRTDGKHLFSYGLVCGHTDEKGNKIVIKFTAKSGQRFFQSHTTSRHVNKAMKYADIVRAPTEEEIVNEDPTDWWK